MFHSRNQPLKRRAAPEEGAGHREERETGDSKPRFSSLLHNPMQNPRLNLADGLATEIQVEVAGEGF